MAVMEVLDLLATASLILAIINIGKYLEERAKRTIVQMTQQIFPEAELLANQQVLHFEPRDRTLREAEAETRVDVSLLDEGDLIRLNAPMRLLVDGVLVHL
jgi:cation transport ATPase